MKKMVMVLILGGFFTVMIAAAPALAAGPNGISISGAFEPFLGGDAGSGQGAPEYDDAFNTGWGVRIEPYHDFNQLLRGLVGFTYQTWSGDTYEGIKFDDLNLWSLYVGVKCRFMPDSKIRPYALADLGYAHLSAVDISAGGFSTTYWNDTSTYLFDFGGGVEFMISQNLSMYVDVRGQIFGEPDSEISPASDADAGFSVPISIGFNFSF